MEDRIIDKHESYAMLQISRTTCSQGQNLFGSSIKHSNTIRLRINQAEVERHLNRDWYHGNKGYIEVEMSYSQFAEAITSLNQGEGVPVTLKYLNGRQIEECPHIDKRQQFENEFAQQVKELDKRLKVLTENTEKILSDKKALTKTDKETILKEIAMVHQEINSNMPFVYSSFNEQMDKTVLEAKGEIEGFTMHKIISAGLKSLESEGQKLVELDDK